MTIIFEKLRQANRKQGDLHVIVHGDLSGEIQLNDEELTSFENIEELEIYLDNIIVNGDWSDSSGITYIEQYYR